MRALYRGRVVLPRLLDRRCGPWPESRKMRMRALSSTRRVVWAVWLARRAETDQHAAPLIDVAATDAARARRLARRALVLRRQGR